jgi:hypothetical protein
MRRGALGIAAIVAAATAVAAMLACTGSDPDIESVPDSGAAATDGTTSNDAGASADSESGAPGDAGVVSSKRQFPCNGAICAGDDVVCCKSADLDGATCVQRYLCAVQFAKIECNDRADCAENQFCCSHSWTEDPDAGGPPFYLGSSCALGCGESVVCSTLADCPDGSSGCQGTTGDYIPTMSFCN